MGLPKPVAIREIVSLRSVPGVERSEREDHTDPPTVSRDRGTGYRHHPAVRETPGAREVFHALHEERIKVALDTGFDRTTLNVVLERLGWNRPGLIDCSVRSSSEIRSRN